MFFLLCGISSAQAVRVDIPPVTTVSSTILPNSPPYAPILAVPYAQIQLFGYPANANPPTNFATTYTDATAATACVNPVQVVLAGTNTCTGLSDGQGNAGFWLIPGNYNYTETVNGIVYGPFPVTAAAGPLTLGLSLLAQFGSASSSPYCVTPNAPDETCLNNALASSANTVTVPAGQAINSTVTVPTGKTVLWMPGTYTLGNSANFIMGPGSSFVCPGGRYATTFLIPQTYSVSTHVITLNGTTAAEQTISGCGFSFYVPPASTTRAGMVHYAADLIGGAQPAVLHIEQLLITGAWNVFNFNSGAANGKIYLDDIQVSSFNVALNMDYQVDTVRLTKFSWHPYGLTSAQFPAFFDAANIGISSGRVDSLKISDSDFDGGQGMSLYVGATSGITVATLSNVSFDTYSGITMTGGQVTMDGGYFSIGNNGSQALVMTGGIFLSSAVQWGIVAANTNQIQISGNTQFYAAASYFNTGTADVSTFFITGNTAYVNIVGNQFLRAPNIAFVNPTISQSGTSRTILADNTATDKGTGLAYFLTMSGGDSYSEVHDNQLLGWSMAMPATYTNLTYHDNSTIGPTSTGAQFHSVFPLTCPGGQHIAAIAANTGIATCN